MSEPKDLAGTEHWDTVWEEAADRSAVDPRSDSIWDTVEVRFHELLSPYLGRFPAGARLIEVGSGASRWLPYFAKEHGFRVTGLDYSQPGVESARRILAANGVSGDVVRADLFSPPDELLGAFDVAISFGVAEHFSDTAEAVAAMAALVRPGGLVITEVPNMKGIPGAVVRSMNPAVFRTHRPLNEAELRSAHEAAGLSIEWSGYSIAFNPAVINLVGLDPQAKSTRLKQAVLNRLLGLAVRVWQRERRRGKSFPAGSLTGAYVFTIAAKPDAIGPAAR